MKLLPPAQPLDYVLMWKCHACSKWNAPDAESCIKCAQKQPILAQASRPRARLIEMLDTVIAYCDDNGLNTCATSILRAVIVAYQTQTEGSLASMCRTFIQLHLHYRQDGDRLLTWTPRPRST
jgi:hypothetical protein